MSIHWVEYLESEYNLVFITCHTYDNSSIGYIRTSTLSSNIYKHDYYAQVGEKCEVMKITARRFRHDMVVYYCIIGPKWVSDLWTVALGEKKKNSGNSGKDTKEVYIVTLEK